MITLSAGSVNLQLAAGAVGAGDIAAGAITNTDISPTAAISWTKIDKTGALLSDFGGNISWPQLPMGAGTWVADPTISGTLTVSGGTAFLGSSPYRTISDNSPEISGHPCGGTLGRNPGRARHDGDDRRAILVGQRRLLALNWPAGQIDFTVKYNALISP